MLWAGLLRPAHAQGADVAPVGVVTVTVSTCYNPAIASGPYSVVANTSSSPMTPNDGTPSSYTTTLANGVSEIIFDNIYTTSVGGSIVTLTRPISTSVLGGPTRTISSTTTLANSVSEVIYYRVYPTVYPDGSQATITQAFSTSTVPPSASATGTTTSVVYITKTTANAAGSMVTTTVAAGTLSKYLPCAFVGQV